MGYCIPKTNYHLMAKSAQFGQLQAGGLRQIISLLIASISYRLHSFPGLRCSLSYNRHVSLCLHCVGVQQYMIYILLLHSKRHYITIPFAKCWFIHISMKHCIIMHISLHMIVLFVYDQRFFQVLVPFIRYGLGLTYNSTCIVLLIYSQTKHVGIFGFV